MKTTIRMVGTSRFSVASPYNPVFVERFRQIEGRKFDGDTKEWSFTVRPVAVHAAGRRAGDLAG
jgi:hypothetical protein